MVSKYLTYFNFSVENDIPSRKQNQAFFWFEQIKAAAKSLQVSNARNISNCYWKTYHYFYGVYYTVLFNLNSLTLHGNPIENSPNYRASIICMFPNLKSLDFAKVTDDEKDAARLHIIVNNSNVKKYSLWVILCCCHLQISWHYYLLIIHSIYPP